jgi:hypothetical protein
MNASKTKTLLSQSGELEDAISTPAFVHHLTGLGDTWSTHKRRRVTCPRCDKPMQEKSFKCHLLSQHSNFELLAKHAKVLEMMKQAPAMSPGQH